MLERVSDVGTNTSPKVLLIALGTDQLRRDFPGHVCRKEAARSRIALRVANGESLLKSERR